MRIVDEARAAIGLGTRWHRLAAGLPRDVQASGLAFLPIAGALLGGVAALGTEGVQGVDPTLGAVAGVLVLEGLAGRRRALVTAVAALAKLAALVVLPTWGRVLPLVLAPVLGRWAVVVQCYGGRPAPDRDPSPFVGRARFREFGWASVTAIGTALVCADALGLLVVVLVAAATVGLRVLAYRRAQGLTRADLERTEAVAEGLVLGSLAAIVTGVATLGGAR